MRGSTTWSSRLGVDPHLVRALAWMESGYQTRIVSSAGARGVLQTLPTTRVYVETVLAGRQIPHTVDGDIEVGILYLRHLLAGVPRQRVARARRLVPGRARGQRAWGVQRVEAVRRERARAQAPYVMRTLLAALLVVAFIPAAMAAPERPTPGLGPPSFPPAWAQHRAFRQILARRQIVSCGGGRGDAVALTFDDGPSPYTMQLLRILQRNGAHATFFDVGNRLAYWPRAALRGGAARRRRATTRGRTRT